LLPLSEYRELAGFNVSITLVNTRQVNFACEFYLRLNLRILGSALNLKEIDSVVEVGVGGPDDCTVPLGECLI